MSDLNDNIETVEFLGKNLNYLAPNEISKWRVETIFSKEPDTIEWLQSMTPEDVLYDVGANMGIYSIFASMVSGCQVRSFEPESQNFYLLMQNIVLNNLADRVIGYPVAIYSEDKLGVLYMGDFQMAQAIHSFDQNVDAFLNSADHQLRQGAASYQLDTVINSPDNPMPTHIKIDVDGLEHEVIAGMKTVLASKELKSVLVEINTNVSEHLNIIDVLKSYGFYFDLEQVKSSQRTEGRFKGLANHIFYRN